jgi:hypothetical protein
MPYDHNAVETLRGDVHAAVNKMFDDFLAKEVATVAVTASNTFKMPTQADGHDARNKHNLNLTARGVEILYRVFDDDGGYNRAAKMLSISQGAAKNRKAGWLKAGGKNRTKMVLDIDGM